MTEKILCKQISKLTFFFSEKSSFIKSEGVKNVNHNKGDTKHMHSYG